VLALGALHIARFTPSQVAAPHVRSVPTFAHDARAPWGSPPAWTGLHVPSLPVTLHASHCPAQSPLQQNPSVHFPDTHSPASVHDCPAPLRQSPWCSGTAQLPFAQLETEQQTLSTHVKPAHSELLLQTVPLPARAVQCPPASQK
jgi:hypothetical protein